MEETAQLLDLIGGIYDAVLEPQLWAGVLERAASFVGGCAASIFWQDSIRYEGNVYYQFGADPEYIKLYFQKYVKLNPLNMTYLTLDVGEVSSNSIMIPPAEFFETRFYKEWVKPQGWIDNAFAILEKSTTSMGAFNVFRHERDGLADEDALRRLRPITPHLRRAALIGKVIDLKASKAATFADMLDALSAGIFLLDATGRVVHANAAGRDIFAAGRHVALGRRSADCSRSAGQPGFALSLHGHGPRRRGGRRSGHRCAADRP
jgi:PAS domain-containing protein